MELCVCVLVRRCKDVSLLDFNHLHLVVHSFFVSIHYLIGPRGPRAVKRSKAGRATEVPSLPLRSNYPKLLQPFLQENTLELVFIDLGEINLVGGRRDLIPQ